VAVLRVVFKEVFLPSSFSPPVTKQQNKNYGTPISNVVYENLELYFSANYLLKYTLNLQHEINCLINRVYQSTLLRSITGKCRTNQNLIYTSVTEDDTAALEFQMLAYLSSSKVNS